MGVNLKELLGTSETPQEAIERIARVHKLTDMQRDFVKEYAQNGGQRNPAMLKAGYQWEKRSIIEDRENRSPEALKARQVLATNGVILLKNKKVTEALKEYQSIYSAIRKSEIEQDVFRISRIRATYDVRNIVDTVVGYSPEEIAEKIKSLDEETALCIDDIEFRYFGAQANKFVAKIKFADRDKNIALLSKLTGLMVERKEVKNTGDKMPTINIAVMGGGEAKEKVVGE